MAAVKDQFLEFSSDFVAQTGEVSSNFSAQVGSVFSPTPSSGTTEKLLGGLRAINSTNISAEDLIQNIVSTGTLSLGFPKEVREFSESLSGSIESIVSALQAVRVVLQALSSLITSLSDPISTLLNTIFEQIEDLIALFTSVDANVRVLPIPPIHPSTSKVENYTAADEVVSYRFSQLVEAAYGKKEIAEQFTFQDSSKIQKVLMGASGASAGYKDGSTGFLSSILESFEDKKDPNRPQEIIGFSAGLVVQAGAPTSIIHQKYGKIEKLFLNGKNRIQPPKDTTFGPRCSIKKIALCGYDEQNNPIINVTLDNPSKPVPKNLLKFSKHVYLPLVVDVLFSENTNSSKSPRVRELGYTLYRRFLDIDSDTDMQLVSPYSVSTKTYADNLELTEFSAGGLTSFSEDEIHIKFVLDRQRYTTYISDSTVRSVSALFKCRVEFKAYAFDKNTDTYTQIPTKDEDVIVTTNVAPLYLPIDPDINILPSVPTGPSPNWVQYGATWSVPGIRQIVEWFRRLTDDLKSLLSTTTNALVSIVNTYVLFIDKLTLLLTRLNNIVFEIDSILDTKVGANYMAFFCNNGVTGIKSTLSKYYGEQEEAYTKLKNSNDSTDSADWFADGESVCGCVILATSERAESVKRLVTLLEALFFSSSDLDNSGQSLLSDELVSGNQFVFDDGSSSSLPLFTENFTGTEDHTASPENVC